MKSSHFIFVSHQQKQYIALTADAKLYEVLQSLKHEYGAELIWLIPFPGDWHTLKLR